MGSQLNGHEFEQTPGDGEGQGSVLCFQAVGLQRVGHDLVTKQQQHIFLFQFFSKEPAFLVQLKITLVRGEQDGGGVGGCGVHLYPQIHQEYTFRHRSARRAPAERGVTDQQNRIYRTTQNLVG